VNGRRQCGGVGINIEEGLYFFFEPFCFSFSFLASSLAASAFAISWALPFRPRRFRAI
jgi:hypothetical protein